MRYLSNFNFFPKKIQKWGYFSKYRKKVLKKVFRNVIFSPHAKFQLHKMILIFCPFFVNFPLNADFTDGNVYLLALIVLCITSDTKYVSENSYFMNLS